MNKKWVIWVTVVAAICSFASSRQLSAGNIKWRTDIKAAAKESVRTQKPMLLKVTADWCYYCKKMKKSFEQEQVAKLVNSCFIPVLVDMDQNQKLADAIGIKGLPTTAVVSPEYKVISKITGYQSAEKLEKTLIKICSENQIVPKEQTGTAIVRMTPQTIPQGKNTQPVQQAAKVAPPMKTVNATEPPLPSPFAPAPPKGNVPAKREQKLTSETVENPFKTIEAADEPSSLLAFKSLCLVSLLDERFIVEGSKNITSTYHGKRVCFSSAEAKKRFDANPERYWPLLDGRCMMSHLDEGAVKAGDPENGAVYKGQLWFFSSIELRQKFADAPRQYVRKLK